MIKKAVQLQPGDVILYNGQPSIVEMVYPPKPYGVEIKLHTSPIKINVNSITKFLVSDKISLSQFVAVVNP